MATPAITNGLESAGIGDQHGGRHARRYKTTRDEYDFTQGKRDAIISGSGKTHITIYLDDSILAEFRARAEEAGAGWQPLTSASAPHCWRMAGRRWN